MDKITLTITKTKEGYKLVNKAADQIIMFEDDDTGRQALVRILVNDFLNAELKHGRKYK